MIEDETGYYVEGKYYSVLPEMIGKKIVHDGRVLAQWGYDGSYCNIHGCGIPSDPKYSYVILREILSDGRLVVESNPQHFPGQVKTLDIEWSTGKWLVVS